MESEAGNEHYQVTEIGADPSNKDISFTTDSQGEIFLADTVELDHHREISASEKKYEEVCDGETASSEPEENCKNEPNQDLDEKINTGNKKLLTHKESVISDGNGPHRLHFETTSPQEEGDQVEEEKPTPAAPVEEEDFSLRNTPNSSRN